MLQIHKDCTEGGPAFPLSVPSGISQGLSLLLQLYT